MLQSYQHPSTGTTRQRWHNIHESSELCIFPVFLKNILTQNAERKCPLTLSRHSSLIHILPWHSCLQSILHAWVLLIEPHRTQVTVLPDTKAAQHGPRNNHSRLTDAQNLNDGSDHESLHERKSPGGHLKPETVFPCSCLKNEKYMQAVYPQSPTGV